MAQSFLNELEMEARDIFAFFWLFRVDLSESRSFALRPCVSALCFKKFLLTSRALTTSGRLLCFQLTLFWWSCQVELVMIIFCFRDCGLCEGRSQKKATCIDVLCVRGALVGLLWIAYTFHSASFLLVRFAGDIFRLFARSQVRRVPFSLCFC